MLFCGYIFPDRRVVNNIGLKGILLVPAGEYAADKLFCLLENQTFSVKLSIF